MHMAFRTLSLAIASTLSIAGSSAAQAPASSRPTIILVHGAFAESSSWNGVISNLVKDGYSVVAAAVPLRSVAGDAAYVSSIVKSTPGSVVLVGHSYGGAVITAAGNGNSNVKALVYVAGFAPDVGESAIDLSGRFPGSTLGPTLAPPVVLSDGGQDMYIRQDKFRAQFAADVPRAQAAVMAATQRPVTQAALAEAAGPPAWKSVPSWSIYGSADKNIPAAALAFMANRAKSRRTVAVKGASHVVMISHPNEVAGLIKEAASAK